MGGLGAHRTATNPTYSPFYEEPANLHKPHNLLPILQKRPVIAYALKCCWRGGFAIVAASVKMEDMSSPSLPPQRPKARAMLDANAQQKVEESRNLWADTPSAGVGTDRGAAGTQGGRAEEKANSRDAGSFRGPSSPKNRPTSSQRSTSPAAGGKPRRKPLRVRSRAERTKWTIGGLTISVRTLVGIAVTVVLLTTLVPLGLQWMKQEQAYRSVVAEVAAVEAGNEAMRDELAEWGNEDYVAAKARDRLGYVRPGETQFVVTDAPDVQSGVEEEVAEPLNAGPAKPWMWHVAETLKDIDVPPSSVAATSTESAGVGGEDVGE